VTVQCGLRRVLWALMVTGAAGCGHDRQADDPQTREAVGPEDTARARITAFWSRYRSATDFRIAGSIDSASEEYARALELDPAHGDALYYLGGMRLALGDYGAAERAWRHLLDVDPSSARAHSQLGGLFLCLDEGAPFRLDSAEAHLTLAHQINREETGPLLHLGEAAMIRGDAPAAKGYFQDVLGSHRSSSAALFYVGYLAWKAGDSGQARSAWDAAVQAAGSAPPPAGVPGEGDTRGGKPMTNRPTSCSQFHQLIDHLDQPPAMEGRYARLDSLLRAARRRAQGN
jgi:tetratricopeptide (TPR) repeat protein